MRSFSLLSWFASVVLVSAGGLNPSQAQIAPDSTLPQSSQVRRSARQTIITGGTRQWGNQFHSFREFSVQSGETASFQDIDAGVTNLFVRVTGRNLSRINGVVEVLDTHREVSAANLFLVNPNGIHFGPNASLRIGGSFIATTADGIRFADGHLFSAVNLKTTELLTVSVPVGLQFGAQPGRIVNQSTASQQDLNGNPVLDSNGSEIEGLRAGAGQTFALVGGNIALNGGQINMDGGRIELGSVAEPGVVRLTPVSQGWDLDLDGIQQQGDIQLRLISTSSSIRGYTIQLQGRRILLDASSISSETTPAQPGGNIDIRATETVTLQNLSNITTTTANNQRAGNIRLATRQLFIRNGGQLTSVTAPSSQGRSGDIDVTASDRVVVETVLEPRLSQILTQSQGRGDAGDLRIRTEQLQVLPGGQISTTAFDAGNSGNMTIQANQIDLIGLALTPDGQPIFEQGLPLSGGLFVGTAPGTESNGGTLRITTNRLRVRDGAILQATTYGSGNAGDIVIRARDSIEVTGASESGNVPARIAATSGGVSGLSTPDTEQAIGQGGNLTLITNQLRIEDQGIIAVNSLNPRGAGAGSIQITANQMTLNNQGQLNAQTESGDNPNLSVNIQGVELLTLRGNSEISTSAGVRSGDGNGGDINIDAAVILDAPAENSDISANAGRETAGNIRIDAQGILGIQEQDQKTPRSDITATAESGVDGEILINSPTLDPTQGIIELPSTVVDASRLIAQGCEARQQTATAELGEFVITGRGGVPPTPTDLRSSSAVITDWATLDPAPHAEQRTQARPTNSEISAQSVHDSSNQPAAIVEAQGWQVDRAGRVALVAQASAGSAQAPTWTVPACREP